MQKVKRVLIEADEVHGTDECVVRYLLELYSLEDLFDVLDVTPERVLMILYEGGHITWPSFLRTTDEEEPSRELGEEEA